MADENTNQLASQFNFANPRIAASAIHPSLLAGNVASLLQPGMVRPIELPTQTPLQPAVAVAPRPALRPLPAVPAAPATNPFADLPFPSPGDRIKAEDFKKLSQSLKAIQEASILTGALVGRTFGEAKQALAAQNYLIQHVMSVFGAELDNPADGGFDSRKVVQVTSTALGERGVAVIVTEAVETRRFMPDLKTLTYRQAAERLKLMLGDAAFPNQTVTATDLTHRSLAEAIQTTQR